jgi:hypothetical protein
LFILANLIEVILVEPVSRAGQDIGLIYAEKRCALTWPLLATGLLATVAGVILVILFGMYGFLINKAFFVAEVIALSWTVFWIRLLRLRWPTGIRVDAAGIRIGDARALRFATRQSQTVFVCPWTVVRQIVVSNATRVRGREVARVASTLRSTGSRHGWIVWFTWLLSPLMGFYAGGSIRLYVDPDTPESPRAGRVDNVQSFGTPATVWLARTRRPRALRAALGLVPGCPPVADRVDPGAALPSG